MTYKLLLNNNLATHLKMIIYFALTFTEIGIGKSEILVIGLVCFLFPTLFIIASRNLDSKGIFDWMMEKPSDWIGKK